MRQSFFKRVLLASSAAVLFLVDQKIPRVNGEKVKIDAYDTSEKEFLNRDQVNSKKRVKKMSSRSLESVAVVTNGSIMLGIHEAGHLLISTRNYEEDSTDASDDTEERAFIGMRSYHNGFWSEAISGEDVCSSCEGFGISCTYANSQEHLGWTTDSELGLTENLVAENIMTNGIYAETEAELNEGHLKVKHRFQPVALDDVTSNKMYEVKIQLENMHFADYISDVRYRRVLMWNLPVSPDGHDQCTSLLVNRVDTPTHLEYTSNFENSSADFDPLFVVSASCTERLGCPIHDEGPVKLDDRFQFLFRNDDGEPMVLGPRESIEFVMYYGAAHSLYELEYYLEAIGAEMASVVYRSDECQLATTSASEFNVIAFRGIGGNTLYDDGFPTGDVVPGCGKKCRKSKRSKSWSMPRKSDLKSMKTKSTKSKSAKSKSWSRGSSDSSNDE